MLATPLAALLLAGATLPQHELPEVRPQAPRFSMERPLSTLPGVMFDQRQFGQGLADQLAKQRGLQGRMLWIDCTANLDRYNSEEKIVALVARIADSGFNTISLDVKPISGQVIWNSNLAPKLTEWRGRTMDAGFDPVPIFSREAKRHGLQLFLALNAFSEGHRMFKVGPGYATPDRQTVLYEPKVFAEVGGSRFPVALAANVVAKNANLLSVFNDARSLPQPKAGAFAITLDPFGNIVDGFERGGMGPGGTTVPRGGSLVVGEGAGAEWLKRHAWPGNRLRFAVDAELVPIQERPEQQIPLIMNPANADVVMRNLEIVRELATNYAFDGLLYDDRLRYGGMNADFSPEFRRTFEQWLGRKVARWPEDVYTITYTPNFTRGLLPGPEYENWLIFRAKTMRDYVAAVRGTLKAIDPQRQFGIYAGSWYGEYASYGANYGADDLDAGFWYLSNAYAKTGFASLLDVLITGCYYRVPTIHEAMAVGAPIGPTVEAAGYLSNRVASDQTWTYAGISLMDFRGNPRGLMNALQAAVGSTQGVMVFDLSHDIEPMWPVFKQAFTRPAAPPTVDLKQLAELRRRREVAARRGDKRPRVIVSSGEAGAGH